jgi:imidazolonepropionase-like amidohydrolase
MQSAKRIEAFIAALVLSALLAAASPAGAATTLVHAGELLAVPGEKTQSEKTIVVRDGAIVSIEDGYRDAAGAGLPPGEVSLIDLSDRFVMPGFIDLHVHLSSETSPGQKLMMVTLDDADMALNAAMNARKTLMAGFTTVRNLGSRGRHIMALRDAIAAHKVPGPRILDAGHSITPTGGHADVHGYRPEVNEVLATSGACDGPDDCRRAVRLQVARGADVIKVTATGGVLSEVGAGTGKQFTDEELRAIVETAHALGRKVTAHAHAKAGIDAALQAGFDSIEHGMWADAGTMKLFKRQGAWLIPTVYPITYVGTTPEEMRNGPFGFLPPVILDKLFALGRQPKDMTRLAYEQGVRIALGTDSGVSPHGENANEFIEYVSIGMSPMEALMAGTVNAADAGGIDGIGRLAPGYAADIVAMPRSPLQDIEAVLEVDFVMRDGRVYRDAP